MAGHFPPSESTKEQGYPSGRSIRTQHATRVRKQAELYEATKR